MSVSVEEITARCVHCAWRTDVARGPELQEVRDIHELIHPGGTALVSEAATPLERIQAIPARPVETTNGGSKVRTCEEVPGCTNPVVASRGPYARVCREHKDLVTERRRREGLSVGNKRGASAPIASPAKGPVDGRELPEVAAEPAPARASEQPAERTLVSLAEQVELARERRREAAAALRAAGEEFHRAIGALSVALEAAETEAADG